MSCCRCCPNLIPMIEIEIKGDILVPEEKPNIKLPLPETNIQKLKDNIICDYYEAISQLEQGKIPNIEFLLEKISFKGVDIFVPPISAFKSLIT